jgi:hypothetical protein
MFSASSAISSYEPCLISPIDFRERKRQQKQSSYYNYTLLKTRQIFENIREEVPWKENFPIIRGNYDKFHRITKKFFLQETCVSLATEICQIFGTV